MQKLQQRKKKQQQLRIPRNSLVQYHPEVQANVLFGQLVECYTSWHKRNLLTVKTNLLENLSENLRSKQIYLIPYARGFTLEIQRQIKIIEFLQIIPQSAICCAIRLAHLFAYPCLSMLLEHHIDLSDVPLVAMQSLLRQESRLNEQITRALGIYREWDEGMQIGAVFSQLLGHKYYESSSMWLRIQPQIDIATHCRGTIEEQLGMHVDRIGEYQSILNCLTHIPIDDTIQLIYSLPSVVLKRDILPTFIPKIHENAPWSVKAQSLIISEVIFREMEVGTKVQFDHHVDHLLTKPLHLIEVLLMNQEWDVLNRAIPALSGYLSTASCPFCHQNQEDFSKNASPDPQEHASNPITMDCLDNLLIVYALQSLDIHIVHHENSTTSSSFEKLSLDFDMPPEAPAKVDWTPDEAVTACMACKSTRFTMLKRRHHCRRCGRVVCKSCSGQRRRIPDMYRNLRVRVCDDCVRWEGKSPPSPPTQRKTRQRPEDDVWILSGDHNEDQMLRDQFTYEDAPSAALCLSILSQHSSDFNVAKFLLWECDRLESLLRPIQLGRCNPEIDYSTIAKMMKCLAIAAKIRVDHPACDNFKLKADIILMVIDAKCESLLPVERLKTSDSLRKLKDNLLSAGVWQLALDISVKCGFAIGGVMQAWGLECLRQGHYMMAREKMSHCLQCLVPDGFLDTILPMMVKRAKLDAWDELKVIDRPRRPLGAIADILAILQGLEDEEFAFSECLYYLILYASHEEILSYLMLCERLHTALLYTLTQKVSYSTFMGIIFLPQLQQGHEAAVLSGMKKIDSTLWRWEAFVKRFCWYLESQRKYESLYNLQILMNDPIRASMTCIQFYTVNAKTYMDLQNNLRYLITAKMHCLSELHNMECGEPVKEVVRITMDTESLRRHIETIEVQINVTEFLSSAEENGEDIMENVRTLAAGGRADSPPPTLFGSPPEANLIPMLTLVSGNSLRRNFALFKTILKITSFPLEKIYESCAIFLATENRFRDIKEMIICAREFSAADINFDKLIFLAVKSANAAYELHKHDDIVNVSSLIELIGDIRLKIKSYIHLGQLKTAYLLAVQTKRLDDLRKIAKRAHATHQVHIRRLCEKYFADNTHLSPQS
ncbi:zinc finger FYVE domain-containing protein 26 homolog isoform X2 [Lutzomyia longipalpis]|uniref:zinc finger FYVE domain-containing protein 26 homolog isoform X2 n=1 Tax=Lutzomyia longipalpis TaxID=7200 RepID=UPI002483FCE5|nr:zinc finger FYVE domain-containing protein 26 homolog isoform X2 [Lutzomyia longipalpis]